MRRPKRVTFVALLLAWGCSSSTSPSGPSYTPPTLMPGEACDETTSPTVVVHFDPPNLVLAPGESRPVRVIVDPDLCNPLTATFAVGDSTLVTAPSSHLFDLRTPTWDFQVQAPSPGPDSLKAGPKSTTLTVTLPPRPADARVSFAGDPAGTTWTGKLPIEVRPDAKAPTCSAGGGASTSISSSTLTAKGSGDLADASLSVPAGAFARTDEWALPPFGASIGCGGDVSGSAPGKPIALGPAVTFTPQDASWLTHSLRRELSFTIPVNPAAMPAAARMRHLQVLYQGPRAKTARPVPIANPRLSENPDKTWVLNFESPWFGTYQAAVLPNAGTVQITRHITHRAVLGISMGGGGAGIFGMRHHDQFDAIAPLGGNSDLTWLVWYFEQFKFGGCFPKFDPNCTTAPNKYPMDEVLAHTEDFDHWFFQPGGGTGGSFSRGDWTQILEDFSIMGGNPNGQNQCSEKIASCPDPAADQPIPYMVVGPTEKDPFVRGNVANTDCSITIDPIGPNNNDTAAMMAQEAKTEMQQQMTQAACLASRCDPKNAWVAKTGFFDGEYNPDGSKPVISFCDGSPQNGSLSPYADTWAAVPAGSGVPSNLTLAVDLNGNGIRDPGEPVIRQGEEPYSDTGTDGKADANEPNFDPVTNPDPDQDDYDFQLNPNGTENDHVWEQGEPYQDLGLDGVAGTPQQSNGGYDVGEGDGKFTLSAGAQALYQIDPHSMLHGRTTPPGGPVDAKALTRLNVWADGGVRDMANFGAVANHLIGAVASVKQTDGTQVKSTAFYNNFENLPGADPTQPDQFIASNVLWADVPAAAHMRYGNVDATAAMIAQGDGQHVGTATQILYRLVTGFYFSASSWPDIDRTLPVDLISDPTDPNYNAEKSTSNELGTACEIKGHCEVYFTGPKTKRMGPLGITLPPGYAIEANRTRKNLDGSIGERYPVLFILHGYGQDPRDLEATAAITSNYESDRQRSSATRLGKMIVVYVDGRCRIDPTTNEPECIRGTFYVNSPRTVNGHPMARLDDWFEEVMTYIDANYRTLGPDDVSVTE